MCWKPDGVVVATGEAPNSSDSSVSATTLSQARGSCGVVILGAPLWAAPFPADPLTSWVGMKR
jgi:hypothetical protein